MTSEQVPLAAQIEKVRREIRYAQIDHAAMAERLWSAVLATLQQHERAMAALREIADMEGCEGMTDYKFAELALGLTNGVLAALDDAASAAATPAGKGETDG